MEIEDLKRTHKLLLDPTHKPSDGLNSHGLKIHGLQRGTNALAGDLSSGSLDRGHDLEKCTKKLDSLASMISSIVRLKNPKEKLPYFKNLTKDQNQELTNNLNALLKLGKKYKKAKTLISEYEEVFETKLRDLGKEILRDGKSKTR